MYGTRISIDGLWPLKPVAWDPWKWEIPLVIVENVKVAARNQGIHPWGCLHVHLWGNGEPAQGDMDAAIWDNAMLEWGWVHAIWSVLHGTVTFYDQTGIRGTIAIATPKWAKWVATVGLWLLRLYDPMIRLASTEQPTQTTSQASSPADRPSHCPTDSSSDAS